jgi:hypothetical protein
MTEEAKSHCASLLKLQAEPWLLLVERLWASWLSSHVVTDSVAFVARHCVGLYFEWNVNGSGLLYFTSAQKIPLILGRRCVLPLSMPLLLHLQRSRIEPLNVCTNPRLLSLLLNLLHLTLRKGRQKFVVLTGLDLLKRHLEAPRFYSLYGNFEWVHPIFLFQHDTFCAPLVRNETV